MTAVVQSGVTGLLARYDAMRDRLPGDPRQRAAAADAFRRAGLPGAMSGRREEAWKYTSLRPVADASFVQPLTFAGDSALLARLPQLDAPRIVFVDGQFRAELSALPRRVEFSCFADSGEFGTLARPDSEPLVALNTMLAEDGAVLSIAPDIDAGLLLLASIATDRAAFHPRHVIRLARGSRLNLLELSVGEGSYLHNPVFEVQVEEGAALTHIRLQNEAPAAFHLSTLYAEVAERGTYDSFVLNLGARIARAEAHVRLSGAKGSAHLNGGQLLGGAQHADLTTVVKHDAPSCSSRQTVKNVLAWTVAGRYFRAASRWHGQRRRPTATR